MSNSTPGPWTTDIDKRFRATSTEQLPESIGVRGPDGMFLACAFDFNRTDRDAEVEANARLIAAAPELLAMLEALSEDCDHYSNLAGEAWPSAAIGLGSSAQHARELIQRVKGR